MKYQQEETRKGNGFGELIISVGYIKEVSAIEVIVVQARDIGNFYDEFASSYWTAQLESMHACTTVSMQVVDKMHNQ